MNVLLCLLYVGGQGEQGKWLRWIKYMALGSQSLLCHEFYQEEKETQFKFFI